MGCAMPVHHGRLLIATIGLGGSLELDHLGQLLDAEC